MCQLAERPHIRTTPEFVHTMLPCAGLVEFRNGVQATYGIELPATVTFDYPTPLALAHHITELLRPTTNGLVSSNFTSIIRDPVEGNMTKIVAWDGKMATPKQSIDASKLKMPVCQDQDRRI